MSVCSAFPPCTMPATLGVTNYSNYCMLWVVNNRNGLTGGHFVALVLLVALHGAGAGLQLTHQLPQVDHSLCATHCTPTQASRSGNDRFNIVLFSALTHALHFTCLFFQCMLGYFSVSACFNFSHYFSVAFFSLTMCQLILPPPSPKWPIIVS